MCNLASRVCGRVSQRFTMRSLEARDPAGTILRCSACGFMIRSPRNMAFCPLYPVFLLIQSLPYTLHIELAQPRRLSIAGSRSCMRPA
eukprot:6209204-Pleurochrysis_carterae.AAC.1